MTNDIFSRRLNFLLGWVGKLMTPRILRAIAVLSFVLISLGTVSLAYFNPAYNWDVLPYIGIATEDELADPKKIHDNAYSEVREAATDYQYYKVTSSQAYRVHMHENPDDFVSLFPLYRVKVGYVAAIKHLGQVFGRAQAAVLISAASALAIGLFILFWSFRQNFVQGLLVVGPVSILIGYAFSAREATPDLLMAALSLPAMYFVIREKPLLAVPFLLGMLAVRPDAILLVFALVLTALFIGKFRLIYAALFVICFVLYREIVEAAGHPGWWAHLYFSTVEYQDDIRDFKPPFDVLIYVKALLINAGRTLREYNWLMVLMVFLLGLVLLIRAKIAITRGQWTALIALTLCIGGKFMTFPLPDDRVYLPYLLPMLLVLVEIWKPDFSWPARAEESAKGSAKGSAKS